MDFPHTWTFRADGSYEDVAVSPPSMKTGKFSRIVEKGTYHARRAAIDFDISSTVTTRYDANGKVVEVKKEGSATSSMDLAWKDADHMSLSTAETRKQPMRLTRRKTA